MYQKCSIHSCEKESSDTICLTDGKELNLCRSCALKKIIKDISITAIVPILTFVLLIIIGNVLFHNQPSIFKVFLIWIVAGIPFGMRFMFNFIHIGVTIPSVIGIIVINLFLGGLIGGFIAVWRLFIAVANLIKSILLIKQIMT